MNMMGPQWLCDCNASGEAETLEEAGKAAASHFYECPRQVSVAVYRKRGDWEYSIKSVEEAEKALNPLRTVYTHTFTMGSSTFPVTSVSTSPSGDTIYHLGNSGGYVGVEWEKTPTFTMDFKQEPLVRATTHTTFEDARKQMLGYFSETMAAYVAKRTVGPGGIVSGL